jgi:hypothetical protein
MTQEDFEYVFCIDCKLEKEQHRMLHQRCVLCERARQDKLKEAGDGTA